MKAVFVTGGKQYYVAENDVIYVEKLPNEAGSEVTSNIDLRRNIVKLKVIDNHILN